MADTQTIQQNVTVVGTLGASNFSGTSSGTNTGDQTNISGNADNVTGIVAVANGGTGQSTQTPAFNALSPTTTKGDVITHNGTNNVRQAVGSNGQVLTADSAQTNGIKWAPSSGISSVSQDPAPSLGGPLDLSAYQVTMTGSAFVGTITQAATSADAVFSRVTFRKYNPSITLSGSQTNASVDGGSLDFGSSGFKDLSVEYTVFDVTSNDRRRGTLMITVNNAKGTASSTFSITDVSTETGDVGVVFSGQFTTGTFNLLYTSTAGTKFMKAESFQMLGPASQ